MSVPELIGAVDGDYERPARRRRLSTMTIDLTAGELPQYVGKCVSVLTKSNRRVHGWLICVRPPVITIDEIGGDDLELRIDELAQFRLMRSTEKKTTKHDRQIAELRAIVASLNARIDELERR